MERHCGYMRPHQAHHVRDANIDCPGMDRRGDVVVQASAELAEHRPIDSDGRSENQPGGGPDRSPDGVMPPRVRDADKDSDR